MAANQVASGTLVIYPELSESVKSVVSKELAGVNAASAGKKVGKVYGSNIASAADKPIQGIGTSLKSVLGVASGIAAAVGFGSLISEAGEAADATLKFKQTLDFANVDGSQIEALTQSTKKYADQTVYDLSDIQNTTAQLAANAVPNYDKLAEAAGNLNAVAGGSADTFKSVGMVLTQTAGAGKLTTENWNQLSDAIPGASGKLQEAMLKNGAYTGNFRDAMAKGEITAEEFNQAIMQLGFEDAAVEAAKSTKTFEGAFGNLKATVVGGLGEAFATLQPSLTGLVNMANDAIAPVFEGMNTSISTFVSVAESTGDPLAGLQAAFETFTPEAKGVAIAIGLIGTAFATAKLVSTGAKVAGAFKTIGGAISNIAGKGSQAAAGLLETAAGETAAGAAGSTSASQILAAAAAVIALGAGVALASAGLWLLANAAIQIVNAGPMAAVALVALVGAVALLAVGAAALAPALTAGAVGMAAFGAAVLMVGAGILLATAGVSLLATQLPTVSAYGMSAAAAFAAVGAAALVLGPGLIVAGAGALILAAGLTVLSVGLIAVGAGVTLAAAGFGLLSVAVNAIAGGIKTCGNGVKNMGKYLPAVGSAAPAAAAGIGAFGGACGLAQGALDAAGSSAQNMAGSLKTSASSSMVLASAISALPAVANASATSFNLLAMSATAAASKATATISSACRRMASEVASCRLKLPRIQVGALPHFYLSGKFDAKSGSVPKVGVNWYAKGGVFDGASIVGVGERGAEAVVPLTSRRMLPFANAIADSIGGAGEVTNYYIDKLQLTAGDKAEAEKVYNIISGWERLARA